MYFLLIVSHVTNIFDMVKACDFCHVIGCFHFSWFLNMCKSVKIILKIFWINFNNITLFFFKLNLIFLKDNYNEFWKWSYDFMYFTSVSWAEYCNCKTTTKRFLVFTSQLRRSQSCRTELELHATFSAFLTAMIEFVTSPNIHKKAVAPELEIFR